MGGASMYCYAITKSHEFKSLVSDSIEDGDRNLLVWAATGIFILTILFWPVVLAAVSIRKL